MPGLAAAGAVAAVAWPVGSALPLVGPQVVALAFGIAAATIRRPPLALRPGLAAGSRTFLQVAIVALGATLSLGDLASVGRKTLPVMFGSLAAAFVAAALAGRVLGIRSRMRTLIGVGTGICGASAIAAVSGIIEATEAEIAYAMSTLFVFNLVAVLLFPPIGHLIGLRQSAFGIWAGTAVNDTSSVVAAAYTYGHSAGLQAVIVKLVRTTMIVPIAIALSIATRRRAALAGGTICWRRIVPWFLVWFVVASALRTSGLIPSGAVGSLRSAAAALIAVALAAVGLSTRLGDLRRAGVRPLLLGTTVWLAVAVSSLALERLVGVW